MQEPPHITPFQKETLKQEYGLTSVEIDTLIRLRMKRNAKTLKKFMERLMP